MKAVAEKHGPNLEAEDYMDDGSPIHLKVEIDTLTGGAIFDFEGKFYFFLFYINLHSKDLELKCTATSMHQSRSHIQPLFIVFDVWLE